MYMKIAIASLALSALTFGQGAHAQADQDFAGVTAADASTMFVASSSPLQISMLSTEEMKSTEGALAWFLPIIGWTGLGAAMGAALSWINNDGNIAWRDVGAGATAGFYGSPVGRVFGPVGSFMMGGAGAASWASYDFAKQVEIANEPSDPIYDYYDHNRLLGYSVPSLGDCFFGDPICR
jgi:hypothetical protein